MHLYTEARAIAAEALAAADGDVNLARDYIHADCDGHEAAIYYHKAIAFCAEQDTSAGEDMLEDCGGIARPGDSFGQIACRIAFATLYVAAQDALTELKSEAEEVAA